MKIRYLKLKNWLLMTAMSLFGLTACHSAKDAAKAPAAESQEVTIKGGSCDEAAKKNPVADEGKVVERPRPRGEAALMYGVPTMDYVLKGRVIDKEGKPVKGMQVILVNQTVDISPTNMDEGNQFVRDYITNASDTTDAEGTFECHMKDVPIETQHVIVRDIDATSNGIYEDQMMEVNFTKEDQTTEGSGWYVGTRTKDVDITVNKKQ